MVVNYRISLTARALAMAWRGRPQLEGAARALHPAAQAVLAQVRQAQALLESVQPLTEEKLIFCRSLAARAQRLGARPGRAKVGAVGDTDFGGVPVRLYRPPSPGAHPLHLYFHGGAFLFGSPKDPDGDAYCRHRCVDADVIVASVDYRLAPEHRFPAGVEDCYTALAWAAAHAGDLGADPARLTVGGASSGGNMAAAVALMARDRGGPPLLLQLLEIPGADLTKTSRAWRDPGGVKDTTREADLALVGFYLARPEDIVHPYASPLMAPRLDGVAPAYVMSAEFDPRRDESEAYVARLQDAGVAAVARTMAGHVHGSYMAYETWDAAAAWKDEANAVLRAANAGAEASCLAAWADGQATDGQRRRGSEGAMDPPAPGRPALGPG